MKIAQTQSGTLVKHSLRWSWALVVVCGLILGCYVFQTYFTPQERQYQLDFGNAQWIEPPVEAPIAYFRKKVFLSQLPERAWLEVAATDNFEVLVNGHTLGKKDALKARATEIYDIKKPLKIGTNVIAVSISRTSFPGSAQLLAYGVIQQSGAAPLSIFSDEGWRVTDNLGIIKGLEEWTSLKLQDELWPNARQSSIDKDSVRLRWADTNPLLFKLPTVGSWIMADSGVGEIVCSTIIDADRAGQETWIQVASAGDLDLLVNGRPVTSPTGSSTSRKRLPHLAVSQPTPSDRSQRSPVSATTRMPRKQLTAPTENAVLVAYDISYWIKKGENRLIATVRNDHGPARLFVDGFVDQGHNHVRQFGSSSHWRMGDDPRAAATRTQKLVEVGKDGSPPFGYLGQVVERRTDRTGAGSFVKFCLIEFLTVALVVALWFAAAAILVSWRRTTMPSALARDALLHGPIVAGLLLLLLPNFDPRFAIGWPFQPYFVIGAVLALLSVRALHLIEPGWSGITFNGSWSALKATELRTLVPYFILALIMILGFSLRLHNLGYMSFDHDEMGLVVKSRGVFKLGYPYTIYAGEARPLTTYELVPYPMALSGLLFGYSEWSMRLPACLMGTVYIGLLGLFGRRLFNWRTGLFTALIYACMPLNIRWAQNAFYLTQCQLMTLLTFWFLYEAFQVRPLRRGYLTAAAVTFSLAYLSWEGSGFILPALLIGLMVLRWGERWWLKEFHLYRCLFFVAVVVVAQYCSRTIFGFPYLQVGSGLSNLSGPSLFFLTPAYQPLFYIDQLWLTENHVLFTVMTLIAIPFCWSHRGFRYVITLLTTLWLLHTNFLAALSPRYCYYFQPLLLLAGVAGTILVYDRLVALAVNIAGNSVSRYAAHATGVCLLILLFLQSNEWLMKEYRLSSKGDNPGLMTRLNTYRYDYRGAAQYVMSHIQPGDLILPGIPHVFEFYAGRPGDFFLDTLLGSKVPYNEKLVQPRFVDKFGGLPAIRNLTELLEVTHRARRTWVVFAPYSSFHKLSAPNVTEYLDANSKIEFESYRAKVLLIQGARSPTNLAAGAP